MTWTLADEKGPFLVLPLDGPSLLPLEARTIRFTSNDEGHWQDAIERGSKLICTQRRLRGAPPRLELCSVIGTLAHVARVTVSPIAVELDLLGRARVLLRAALTESSFLAASASEIIDLPLESNEVLTTARDLAWQLAEALRPLIVALGRECFDQIDSPGYLADYILVHFIQLSSEERLQALETFDADRRLRLAIRLMKDRLEALTTAGAP